MARNTLLNAADNSLHGGGRKISAGQEISATTATLGQVDRHHAAPSSRAAASRSPDRCAWWPPDLAPSFFTTVDVDGNQMRECVEHLPPGTPRAGRAS